MPVVVVLDVVARVYSAVGTCGCGVTGCDRTRVYMMQNGPVEMNKAMTTCEVPFRRSLAELVHS